MGGFFRLFLLILNADIYASTNPDISLKMYSPIHNYNSAILGSTSDV
jgi:hypothetical protein